jgi:hypothetical protein
MIRLTSTDARCALFASVLQQSDLLSMDVVAAAISAAVEHFGLEGCLNLMAQEFGDHPDTASERMQWVSQLELPSVS